LLDDNRDKEVQRKQLIAIVLMTLLVVGWSYFFLPTAPPAKTPPPTPQEARPLETQPAQNTTASSPVTIQDAAALAAWPPVANSPDPSDEVILQDDQLAVTFTRVGARLKRATVLLGDKGADSIQLVPEMKDVPDAEAVYPFGLRFSSQYLGDELDKRRWEVLVNTETHTAVFTIEAPGVAKVIKTFTLDKGHTIDVNVEYVNLESAVRVLGLDKVEPAFSLNWGPNVESGDKTKGVQQTVVWRKTGKNEHHPTANLKPPADSNSYSTRVLGPDWIAVKSAYFVVALKPNFEEPEGWVSGDPKHFRIGVGAPRMQVEPGKSETRSFRAYLGPTLGKSLREAWPGLDEVLEFFTMFKFMDTFAKWLLAILNWFHNNLIANYGLAIIFLTVLVRLAVFPLTMKSMKNMKKMQKLAPELEKIKAEVGDNQQELQKRMMEMYRERGVSPLGGCLPMFLQLPVFIALYRMLWSAFELRRAPFFLWMTDLSEPDRFFSLSFGIPVPFSSMVIDSINLLPILGGVAMVLSVKLTPTSGPAMNPQQKMMMTIMPVFFSIFCYNLAAGLNLYILISTLLGIGQNMIVQRINIDVDVKEKKPLTQSKHFYSIAQARKRQMNKEVRRDKKLKDLGMDGKGKKSNKK